MTTGNFAPEEQASGALTKVSLAYPLGSWLHAWQMDRLEMPPAQPTPSVVTDPAVQPEPQRGFEETPAAKRRKMIVFILKYLIIML